MDAYIPLGDTRYVYRISKFITFFAFCLLHFHSEVGIYKRKQESKKTRIKRTRPRKRSRKQENDQEKKKNLYFFLDYFLGRALVFLFS